MNEFLNKSLLPNLFETKTYLAWAGDFYVRKTVYKLPAVLETAAAPIFYAFEYLFEGVT